MENPQFLWAVARISEGHQVSLYCASLLPLDVFTGLWNIRCQRSAPGQASQIASDTEVGVALFL